MPFWVSSIHSYKLVSAMPDLFRGVFQLNHKEIYEVKKNVKCSSPFYSSYCLCQAIMLIGYVEQLVENTTQMVLYLC